MGLMWIILALILDFVAPIWAEGAARPRLTAEALASCLDQSETIDRIDETLSVMTARDRMLHRATTELALQIATLRDTARVDAAANTQRIALQVEIRAAKAAREELEAARIAALTERRIVLSSYNRFCSGYSYTAAELQRANALRGR